MFCSKCGTEIPEGAEFCSKCGANLSDTPQSSEKNGKDFSFDQLKGKNGCCSMGCGVIGLFILIGWIISLFDGDDAEKKVEQPKKELTIEEQYEERLGECLLGWDSRKYVLPIPNSRLVDKIKRNLNDPDSFKERNLSCDFIKEGKIVEMKDTIKCYMEFTAKTGVGANVKGYAAFRMFLPPYSPEKMEYCDSELLAVE